MFKTASLRNKNKENSMATKSHCLEVNFGAQKLKKTDQVLDNYNLENKIMKGSAQKNCGYLTTGISKEALANN